MNLSYLMLSETNIVFVLYCYRCHDHVAMSWLVRYLNHHILSCLSLS